MPGIEDFVKIFRGENLNLNPFSKKETGNLAGRFITDNLEYAKAAADKFPAIIKSAQIPAENFLKSMKLFSVIDSFFVFISSNLYESVATIFSGVTRTCCKTSRELHRNLPNL